MGPIAQADGHNAPWLICELVPGFTAMADDVFAVCEHAVRKPVIAHKLQEVFDPSCDDPALAAIATEIAPGAHAVLLVDQAGWHMSNQLIVLPSMTIMPHHRSPPQPEDAGFANHPSTAWPPP